MYLEKRDGNRTSWKYTYTGRELLPFAQKRLAHYSALETSQRSAMAKLLIDPGQNVQGDEANRLKSDIEKTAIQHEMCTVYVHEFERSLDREFHLDMSDVVYFGIAGIK